MPTALDEKGKEKLRTQLRKIKERWDGDEVGTGGVKRVRSYDFKDWPMARLNEVLTEPTILTADGIEKCVIMALDDYFSRMPPRRDKPLLMRRIEGKLYREV